MDLLPKVLLKTANGGGVTLSSVAALKPLGLAAELDRRRLRPVIAVTARADGIALGTAVARVKARLADLALPPGVTLEYGGLYAEQQAAFHQLTLVLISGIAGMFLVLLWEFGRLGPSLAVLIGAVACLAGSFVALNLTGETLNISSFMGVIMVAGITAKNGILLLDHTEHEVAAGADPRSALLNAARMRMRPILMTTVATVAGLLPLAIGHRRGRQGPATARPGGDRRPGFRPDILYAARRRPLSPRPPRPFLPVTSRNASILNPITKSAPRSVDGPYRLLLGRDVLCIGVLTLNFDGHFTFGI